MNINCLGSMETRISEVAKILIGRVNVSAEGHRTFTSHSRRGLSHAQYILEFHNPMFAFLDATMNCNQLSFQCKLLLEGGESSISKVPCVVSQT